MKNKLFSYSSLDLKGIMENPNCAPKSPDPLSALFWTTIAVFGIVYALLGYRCLRAIGFLSGLLVGANIAFVLQDFKVTLMGSPADSAFAILSGLIGAVLGSAHPIASALVSAFAGALLAATTMVVCVATMPDHTFGSKEIYVAIIGGAIIFSVLTLCCVKFITILASSIVGTAMILAALDFFLNDLETLKWLVTMAPNPQPPPCYGGILIFSWPVSVIVSLMVQCFITGWRVDHRKYVPRYRHHPPPRLPPLPPNSSRGNSMRNDVQMNTRQRKYRYLYQVRTARGDIISQNFVSALQKRVQQHGYGTPPSTASIKTSSHDRNTMRSDRTHFTNIPDTEMYDNKFDLVNERG
uniref:Transmembrane protein 198 n=1 Tax=Megaselia scalaris TaxID=36166 RepID=T1H4V1_MEGSC